MFERKKNGMHTLQKSFSFHFAISLACSLPICCSTKNMHISHKAINDQVLHTMKKCRVVVSNIIFKVLGHFITDL